MRRSERVPTLPRPNELGDRGPKPLLSVWFAWCKEVAMRAPVLALMAVVGFGLLSAPALLQQKGGEEETGPYEVVPNWPAAFARPGYIQGSQGGVFAESPDRIILLNR